MAPEQRLRCDTHLVRGASLDSTQDDPAAHVRILAGLAIRGKDWLRRHSVGGHSQPIPNCQFAAIGYTSGAAVPESSQAKGES